MKRSFFLLTLSLLTTLIAYNQGKKSALLLIDIQDFYFPGGKSELVDPEKAASNAEKILETFRSRGLIVVHVRHNSEPGGTINKMVKPLDSERIFSKDDVNCFKGTGLNEYLKVRGTDTLVICGMQTHMCVEAAVRAGSDLGYTCILIGDACATKDLKYGEKTIRSEDVHYSTLSTLKAYSLVVMTVEFLTKK